LKETLAKHYFEDFSHLFQQIVASKENENNYLEVGNYDPLGYINLNKILEKITRMFMKQNYGNAFQPIKGYFTLTCTRHYKLNKELFNIYEPQIP
jgi:hypothetical protein